MGQADGGNTALRALLDEAEMSNAALARAVVSAGAAEGAHVGTNTTSVQRMLDGAQPRWPVPRLVAQVVSRRLHREFSVTECGFADRRPAAEDPHDGLHCSGTLDTTVRTVVELSGQDMDRRKFLLGSAFSAAAFSEPALLALTVPPTENTARAAGRRIGMPEVEIITEHIAHLRQLDHRYGSGRVREQVVQLLHREANTVLHGTYSEKTGKALLGAVAQATRLAGAMASDVGRHSLAQRYYTQTLNLSMSAGNRLQAANVLNDMSRLTLHIGRHRAVTEDDRLRTARQAVALHAPVMMLPMAKPHRRCPHCSTRLRRGGMPCSVTSTPPAWPYEKQSGTTNDHGLGTSHRGSVSTPKPDWPPISAAACGTSANRTKPSD